MSSGRCGHGWKDVEEYAAQQIRTVPPGNQARESPCSSSLGINVWDDPVAKSQAHTQQSRAHLHIILHVVQSGQPFVVVTKVIDTR